MYFERFQKLVADFRYQEWKHRFSVKNVNTNYAYVQKKIFYKWRLFRILVKYKQIF